MLRSSAERDAASSSSAAPTTGSAWPESSTQVCPANPLQSLLEQAMREALREFAQSAAESVSGAPTPSLDCIVRSVAAKVMEDARAGHSLPDDAARERTEPKLADLKATQWLLWSKHTANEVCPAITRRDSYRVPRVGWMSDPTSPTATVVKQGDAGGFGFEAVGLSDVARESPNSSGCDGGKNDVELAPEDTRNVVPSHRSSIGGSPTGFSGSGMQGPLVITSGLQVDSNTDQHLMMQWKGEYGAPGSVLIIAKPGDVQIEATLMDMVQWLSFRNVVTVLEEKLFNHLPALQAYKSVRTFTKADDLAKRIDLVITIGGDGTLTWAVSLFNTATPPVLSFAAGSLGFLTPFPFDGTSWKRVLESTFNTAQVPMPLVCRMRLQVVVHRNVSRLDQKGHRNITIMRAETSGLLALNEVLIHRGQSGALAKLDVAVDGQKVTVLQGDGVILATPTGSTAYSLSAGGSMAHPSVPAILLTPVSPHSLSFRPAVLPDSAVVTVSVPMTARHGASLSVDGKDVCFLKLGDSVEVSSSTYPVPTICRQTGTADWFNSVQEALQWNGRSEQKGP